MKDSSFSLNNWPRYTMAVFLIVALGMGSIRAQNHAATTDTDNRLLNFGIKSALSHFAHYPHENPSKLYAADNALFDFQSYTHSLDVQVYRPNALGWGVELGYRKHTGKFSRSSDSQLLSGGSQGELPIRSIFVGPSLIYNRVIGERWVLTGSMGAELHSSLRQDTKQSFSDENHFRQTTQDFFTNLSTGLEIRMLLDDALWLGFFVKGLYGLSPTSELFFKLSEDAKEYKIGHYRGTGFDFGLKLSYCLSCR